MHLPRKATLTLTPTTGVTSALEDHEKSDLDPDQDHLPKGDLRSRSDPDLT